MIISTTAQNICQALIETNRVFKGNIKLNNFKRLSDTRYRVTLRVSDSKDKGARIGQSGRRLISACWHAHGTFIDSLPAGTRVRTSGGVFYPQNGWHDRNIGSKAKPMLYSQACRCWSGLA